jgi:hypothetical protein
VLDPELLQRLAVVARPRVGGEDLETVERERARDPAEQAGPVGGHDGHDRVVDAHAQTARGLGQQPAVVGRREARRLGPSAFEGGADPPDQLHDEVLLPRGPRGVAGGARVRLSQRGEDLEGVTVADGFGDGHDGGFVADVAPGRGVGQQQMVPHEGDEHVDIARREPQPGPDAGHELHPGVGVVTRVALAQVVEPRAHEQQVGARHAPGERGGARDRLAHVPVDGEAVVGVALGPAAHGLPLGQDAHQQSPLIERLEHLDGVGARAQQRHQGVPGRVGPGLGAVLASRPHPVGGQAVEGATGDRRARLRRRRSEVEQQHTIAAGVDVGRERDLAVAQHHPRRQRAVAARHPAPRTTQRRDDAAPRVIARPRDQARRRGDVGHQRVGVRVVQGLGHTVLLLQEQTVTGTPRPPLQLDARCEQCGVRRGQCGVVALEQDAARHPRPAEGVHVAEATPSLLEIGLEQERDLTGACVPLLHRTRERVQLAPAAPLPLLTGAGGQLVGERVLTRHASHVEQ